MNLNNPNYEYFLLFRVKTGISLSNQKKNSDVVNFRFNSDRMDIFAKDYVSMTIDKSINDYGLEFIVKIIAENDYSAINDSANFIETFVNLLCFATLCHAKKPELLSMIRKDSNTTNQSTLFLHPHPNKIFLTNLCIIDQDFLQEILENFSKSKKQDRILRAITWLRKGLIDENFDEFISYWIALEILSPILNENDNGQYEEKNNWRGVKQVFSEYLDLEEKKFVRIKKEYRQGIFHGFKELNHAYLNEVNAAIPIIRKGVIACICKILNCRVPEFLS